MKESTLVINNSCEYALFTVAIFILLCGCHQAKLQLTAGEINLTAGG